MGTQTKGAAVSSRQRPPNPSLSPVLPCSQTHIGDVLFIRCTVLGRQALRETEEDVQVGTPPRHLRPERVDRAPGSGLSTYVPLPHFTPAAPPTPWVSEDSPPGSENTAPVLLLEMP